MGRKPREQKRHASGQTTKEQKQPIEPILKVLCSYFYFREIDIAQFFAALAPLQIEIMADSGGFSAHTLKKPITLQGYIDWCHRWKHILHSYAVLDDLFNAQGTWENQREMERQGLSPLPIFHFGEDYSWLERYLDRYPYIMLGGMAGVSGRNWQQDMPWLIQCFKRNRGRAVFHGLGISAQRILTSLPFYSADASTFLNATKFGTIGLFDRTRNQWEFIRSNGLNVSHHQLRLLQEYGLSARLLRDELPRLHRRHLDAKSPGPTPYTCTVTSAAAAAWPLYEAHLRDLHGDIVIPGRLDLPVGLRYYLVMNHVPWLHNSSSTVGLKKILGQAALQQQAG